jgi:hypothetical protein
MNLRELEWAARRARLDGMSGDDEVLIVTALGFCASGTFQVVRTKDGARVCQITTAAADADNLAAAAQHFFAEKNGSIVLPGFRCAKCGAFTGTEKEELQECRCCGAPRP